MTKFIGKKSHDDSKDKQSQIALIIEEILKESLEPLKSEDIVKIKKKSLFCYFTPY